MAKKFKKLKTSFQHYFQHKGMRQAEKKKNLDPNAVPTQPKLENFKINNKKIQKIKKVNSGIISIQNGLREAEKE